MSFAVALGHTVCVNICVSNCGGLVVVLVRFQCISDGDGETRSQYFHIPYISYVIFNIICVFPTIDITWQSILHQRRIVKQQSGAHLV